MKGINSCNLWIILVEDKVPGYHVFCAGSGRFVAFATHKNALCASVHHFGANANGNEEMWFLLPAVITF